MGVYRKIVQYLRGRYLSENRYLTRSVWSIYLATSLTNILNHELKLFDIIMS